MGTQPHLILGSASPRRKQLLEQIGIPFVQVSADLDEEAIPFLGDPEDHAAHLAQAKGEHIAKEHPSALVLTADTVVYRSGRLYAKPADMQEAFHMLSELTGSWHTVCTAVCGRLGAQVATEVSTTRVLLERLTPLQIQQYLFRVHCLDKAGSYAIQGIGGIIVKEIHGSYTNVVGLPLDCVQRILRTLGVDLWEAFGAGQSQHL